MSVDATLIAFIESECDAINQNKSNGDWYVMHWQKLKKSVVLAAPQHLSDEMRIKFYSLLLRKSVFFDECIKDHYLDWEEAYRVHTPWMIKKPYSASSSIGRLYGLCIFGFDYALQIAKNQGYDDYSLYRQAHTVHGNNMPDILKRAERLLPFANNEKVIKRFGDALKALNFIYDDWYNVTSTEENYGYTDLGFFHLLLMLHLSKTEEAKAILNEYKKRLPFLPKSEEQKVLIERCEKVAKKWSNP